MFNNELEALEALYNLFLSQNVTINEKIDNMLYSVDALSNSIDNIINVLYMRVLMPVFVLACIWFFTWLLFKIFKD